MRLIIDIDEEIYKGLKEHFDDGNDGLKSELAIANGIPLDDKTNGDVIKTLFPSLKVENEDGNDEHYIRVKKYCGWIDGYKDTIIRNRWWNSLYEENK